MCHKYLNKTSVKGTFSALNRSKMKKEQKIKQQFPAFPLSCPNLQFKQYLHIGQNERKLINYCQPCLLMLSTRSTKTQWFFLQSFRNATSTLHRTPYTNTQHSFSGRHVRKHPLSSQTNKNLPVKQLVQGRSACIIFPENL